MDISQKYKMGDTPARQKINKKRKRCESLIIILDPDPAFHKHSKLNPDPNLEFM
jgi:hypothetical protein